MNIFRRCTTRLILPIFIFVFPAVALIFSATNVSSTEILSPAAVINNTLGEVNANTVAGNIINQSGLSASFTSRVTDFATYIAGNPTHAPLSSGNFLSTLIANGTAGILDFDLGGLFGVSNFIMWGDNAGGLSTD